MRILQRLAASGLVLAPLYASTAACGGGGELPAPFPLAWQGVESSPSLTERGRMAAAGKTFHFERIVDRRADPNRIGVDEETNYQYRTTSNVSDFTTERVKQILGDSGLPLQDSAQYTIQGELVAFDVKEGDRFQGDVRVLFRVFKVGSPAFEQTYMGKASNHGRSHSPDNINEALSAAMLSVVSQFLHDELLASFLEGKGGPSPAASAAPVGSAPSAPAPGPLPSSSAAPKKPAGPRTL